MNFKIFSYTFDFCLFLWLVFFAMSARAIEKAKTIEVKVASVAFATDDNPKISANSESAKIVWPDGSRIMLTDSIATLPAPGGIYLYGSTCGTTISYCSDRILTSGTLQR